MGADKTGDSTPGRLLDAAGRTFADQGYRAATVRQICKRAGVSVATINYHFGSKRKLYAEVLSAIFHYAMSKYPPDLGQDKANTPEEKLHAFVRSFLLRRLDPGRPAWHRRLLRREMVDPSAAKRAAIEKAIREARVLLRGILAELLGRGAEAEHVDTCAASIVGQCLYYQHGRPVVCRELRPATVSPEGIDKLARHITEFSLGGLERTHPFPPPARAAGEGDRPIRRRGAGRG